MSIKDFHIVFIICAILLTIGFGMWALNNYGEPTTPGLRAAATVSFLISISLMIYCIRFIRKMRAKF